MFSLNDTMRYFLCPGRTDMRKGIGAAASVPGNLVQGAVGLVAGFLLLQVARRTHLEEKVSV